MAATSARDPLKEAEARVRALTREVGALREDLRRETKRRERAVSQSQEAEAARSSTEHKLHELTYANRKLAAEVEAAQTAAKAAGERDRRALRTLREGLAEVEGAVAQRAERGSLQVASAFGHVNTLRAMLLSCGPSGSAPVLPHALANSVTHTLADIIRGLSALSALLTNAPDAEEQAAAALSAGRKDGPDTGGGGGNLDQQKHQQPSWPSIKEAGAALLSGAKIDLEKEGLRDEVHRLRVQLRTLVEEQSGTANAAALSLQSQLRSYMADAETTQADLQAHIKQRDAMLNSLRAELQHSNRIKGAEEEKVHAELLAKLHEQASEADALRARLAALQADLAAAEGICKESAATTEALGTEVRAQAARAEQAESAWSSMLTQFKGQSEEAEALRVEVGQLHQALQAMGHEGKALQAELERLQDRLHAAEAAGAGDAAVVAKLRLGQDAALNQVRGLQQKITQLQNSEAAAKQEWELAKALLVEREAQLAKCQAQLASQATHLASLQATITAQNEDMTRALSLVTQGNPHHPPPSLTKAKRAASSPNPHPHLSHRNLQQPLQEPQPLTHPPPQPLQQPPQTCPPSPPVLPQQTHEHRHYHHPPQHPPQQDLLLGVGQGQGGSSSPRAPAEPHLLPGHASPGALPPRTAAACPASAQGLQSLQSTSFRGPASPEPINPQQELQQLLQLQQERQQGMLAAHAHPPPPQPPPFPPPPLVPDRAWAASPQLAPGMQAGATQQPTPRHHIYSPTAENAPHSASLGHLHHHHHNNYDCDLGGSSNQPAAHAAPFLDSRLTQRSPLAPSGAHPRPLTSVPANAAAPVEARALQPLSPAATATLSPPPAAVPKGAVLRAESWGSHASSDKENAPAQDILFPRHPGLHQTTASTSPQTQPLPSPHLQEPSLLLPPQLPPQQGGTLGIGGPTAAQQQASEPWSSSHQDRDSRHRDGTYLEMVPPSSRGGIGFNPTAPVGPTQLQAPALWSSYKDWGSRHREGGHLGAGGGHLGAGAGRHIEAGAGGHLRAGSTVGHLGAGAGGHFEAGAGRHLEAGAGGHLRAGSAAGHLGAGQATGAGAGGHLGGGPAAALGAGHARSCHSSPNNAAAGAEVEGLTQPPQPDRRLHALVDQLRSSRVASAAQQRTQGQGSSSSHGSSAPGGVGEQLGMGGLHTGRSLSPHTDRAASWPATGQGVVGSSGGSGNSNGGSGGGGSGGFGSIATASTGESRSPAVPGAALPPSSTTATAAGVANEAASAPKDCISSVWRRSGNHEQRPSHAFPHLSLDHSAHQGAAAQMPLPDRQPLSTLRPPSSNTPIGSIQGLPGQGVTSPASSCSSSSPSCAAGAQGPLPATAPAVSKARHTGALPACSFSFRNREGVKWADQEGAQPALGPGNGCSSAESHLATDLQLHMRTLDSEIEALGASLTAAARNAGVAAT